MRIQKIYMDNLHVFNKQKAIEFLNDSLKTKLPFSFTISSSGSLPVQLNGSKEQSRTDRFTDRITPQFAVDFLAISYVHVMSILLTVDNKGRDDVSTRQVQGRKIS